MTYATLMVHLELGRTNTGVLQIARELTQRFKCSVIGIAAAQPMQIIGDGSGYGDGEIYQFDQDEIDHEITAAEAEFRSALEPEGAFLQWRSMVTPLPLAHLVAAEARGADLIVTAASAEADLPSARRVNTGDLVMRAGRPVLVFPAGANTIALDRMVIGWKDAREPRRAVADALPLLQQANHVVIAGIAKEDDLPMLRRQLDDVSAWLKRHGIKAEPQAMLSDGDDARLLADVAHDEDAGVVVAGAYGHSRMLEWTFGGVTRDLLLRPGRCSCLSH